MDDKHETIIDGESEEIENKPKLTKRFVNWFSNHRRKFLVASLITITVLETYSIAKAVKEIKGDNDELMQAFERVGDDNEPNVTNIGEVSSASDVIS